MPKRRPIQSESKPGMTGWRPIISNAASPTSARPSRVDMAPFGDAMCTVVESAKPEVVSFHFGLPDQALLARVRAAGCRVISSATTVEEARWLEARGVD